MRFIRVIEDLLLSFNMVKRSELAPRRVPYDVPQHHGDVAAEFVLDTTYRGDIEWLIHRFTA
jgi:hypothetical protein